MMKNRIPIILIALALSFNCLAQEYHVAKTGIDKNNGSLELPFLTIQAAAIIAQPGDVITVHEGVYRESVNPPQGGTSNENCIIYQAAEGERVEIMGSEIINNWVKFSGTIWKATIPNSLFGKYNPYKDLIHGDLFMDKGRIHHTGEVYMNGKSFWEMENLEKVQHPKPAEDGWDKDKI